MIIKKIHIIIGAISSFIILVLVGSVALMSGSKRSKFDTDEDSYEKEVIKKKTMIVKELTKASDILKDLSENIESQKEVKIEEISYPAQLSYVDNNLFKQIPAAHGKQLDETIDIIPFFLFSIPEFIPDAYTTNNSSQLIINTYRKYISLLKNDPDFKSCEKISKAVVYIEQFLEDFSKSFSNNADNIKMIKTSKDGSSTIIPIGYVNTPIVCEITKKNAKNYQIAIYNLGVGSDRHPSIFEKGKTKIATRIVFEDDGQLICEKFAEKANSFAIMELKDDPPYEIYQGLLSCFKPINSKDYIFQEIDNGKYSSINAYLFTKIPEVYDKVRFLIILKIMEMQVFNVEFTFIGIQCKDFLFPDIESNPGWPEMANYGHFEGGYDFVNFHISLYRYVIRYLYTLVHKISELEPEIKENFNLRVHRLSEELEKRAIECQIKHSFPTLCHGFVEFNATLDSVCSNNVKPIVVNLKACSTVKSYLVNCTGDLNQFVETAESFIENERNLKLVFKSNEIILFSYLRSLADEILANYSRWLSENISTHRVILNTIEKLAMLVLQGSIEKNNIKYELQESVFSLLEVYQSIWILYQTKNGFENVQKEFENVFRTIQHHPKNYSLDLFRRLSEDPDNVTRLYIMESSIPSKVPSLQQLLKNETDFKNHGLLFGVASQYLNKMGGNFDFVWRPGSRNHLAKIENLWSLRMNDKIFDCIMAAFILSHNLKGGKLELKIDDWYYKLVNCISALKNIVNDDKKEPVCTLVQYESYYNNETKTSIRNSNLTLEKSADLTDNNLESIRLGYKKLFVGEYVSNRSKENFENNILHQIYRNKHIYRKQSPLYNPVSLPHASILSLLAFISQDHYYITEEQGTYALYSTLLANGTSYVDEWHAFDIGIRVFEKLFNQGLSDINKNRKASMKLMALSYIAVLRMGKNGQIYQKQVIDQFNMSLDKMDQPIRDYLYLVDCIIREQIPENIMPLYDSSFENLTILEDFFPICEIYHTFCYAFKIFGSKISEEKLNSIRKKGVMEEYFRRYPTTSIEKDVLKFMNNRSLDATKPIKVTYMINVDEPAYLVSYKKVNILVQQQEAYYMQKGSIAGVFINNNETDFSIFKSNGESVSLLSFLGCKEQLYFIKTSQSSFIAILEDGTHYATVSQDSDSLWTVTIQEYSKFAFKSLDKVTVFKLGTSTFKDLINSNKTADVAQLGSLTFNISLGNFICTLSCKDEVIYIFPRLNCHIISEKDRNLFIFDNKEYKILDIRNRFTDVRMPILFLERDDHVYIANSIMNKIIVMSSDDTYKNTFETLITVFTYLTHSMYSDAFKATLSISSTFRQFTQNEVNVIKSIMSIELNGVELTFFKALYTHILDLNYKSFGSEEKVDKAFAFQRLKHIFDMLPTHFNIISSSSFVDFNNENLCNLFLDNFNTFENPMILPTYNLKEDSQHSIISKLSKPLLQFIEALKKHHESSAQKPNIYYKDNILNACAQKDFNIFKKEVRTAYSDYIFSSLIGHTFDDEIAGVFFNALNYLILNRFDSELTVIHNLLINRVDPAEDSKAILVIIDDVFRRERTRIFSKANDLSKYFKSEKSKIKDNFFFIQPYIEAPLKTASEVPSYSTMDKIYMQYLINTAESNNFGYGLIQKILLSKNQLEVNKISNDSKFYNKKWADLKKSYKSNNLEYFNKIRIIMESFGDIKIFDHQITALEKIFSTLDSNKSIIYQKMMGGGKTSVLGPCVSLYVTHVKNKIPIFIFPQNLVSQNCYKLSETLMKVFNKKVMRLHMNRNSKFVNNEYLESVLKMLNVVYHSGDALICSPEVIQCFQNVRKEIELNFAEYNEQEDQYETIKYQRTLIREILKFIKNNTVFIIDEIDTVMDLTKSFNFNASEKVQHNQDDISILIDIMFSFYANHKDAFKAEKLEFDLKKIIKEEKLKYNKKLNDNEAEEYLHLFIKPLWDLERNVKYGLSHKNWFLNVIPYRSANVPSEGSSFANFFFSLGLSIKYYLDTHFTETPLFFEDKITHSSLTHILGLNRSCESEELLRQFNLMKDDSKLFKQFINGLVVHQIDTYKHQYISSPYEFISAANQFVGYSGTLFNKEILEFISKDTVLDASEGEEIETKILKSFENGPENYPLCHNLKNIDLDTIINVIKSSSDYKPDSFKDKKRFSALFDSGALLKEYKIEYVAEAILVNTPYKCVLFFNSSDQTLSYKTKLLANNITANDLSSNQFDNVAKKLKIDKQDIFLYLDESQTIGADVMLNDPDAWCFTTLSIYNNTKQLYQTVLRARDLLKEGEHKQRITFLCYGINGSSFKKDILALCEENKKQAIAKEVARKDYCKVFSILNDEYFNVDSKNVSLNDRKNIFFNQIPENMTPKTFLTKFSKIFNIDQTILDHITDKPVKEVLDKTVEVITEQKVEIQSMNVDNLSDSMRPKYQNLSYHGTYTNYDEKKFKYLGNHEINATENFFYVLKNRKEENITVENLSKPPVLLNSNGVFISLYEANEIGNYYRKSEIDAVWSPYLLEFMDATWLSKIKIDANEMTNIMLYSGFFCDFSSIKEPHGNFYSLLKEANEKIFIDNELHEYLLGSQKRWTNLNSEGYYQKAKKIYNSNK